MVSNLFILFDPESNEVLEGPSTLPANLIDLSMEELNAINWYLALQYEYDIDGDFDPNVFNVETITYTLITEPFPAIRQYVTTSKKDLDVVRRYIVFKLTEYRDGIFNKGFVYGTYWFDSDVQSRLNWTAAVTSMLGIAFIHGLTIQTLAGLPGYQNWTRKDNEEAEFTHAEVLDCGLKLGGWASSCYSYCRRLKNQVLRSNDFDEIWAMWTNNELSDWPNCDLGGSLSLAQPPVAP